MNHTLLIRTAKRWNISRALAEAALVRDQHCVYCRREFEEPQGQRAGWPSWEHIINDISIVTEENIVLCCLGCNASKGTKALETWLKSKYCLERGIKYESMAPNVLKLVSSTSSDDRE